MSLRKSTCLTPQRLDAARHNSQRSTGPRSEAGKERMKMNALKHGCDDAPENEAAVMRALGEDPERYAALQRELATAYGPGDAFWDHQVADLGKLYWRRNRAAEELSKVVGLDAGRESPAEQNAGETSKSPEQSENVIENKGPAAEGVRQ
ncbi:MAG: hypothetical protein ABSE79_23905 [Terriglobia bacterium]